MVKPPEAKVYSLQLHRVTLWTVGCGVVLLGGVLFLAGSLVGAWWVTRPSPALKPPASQQASQQGIVDPSAMEATPSATATPQANTSAGVAGPAVSGPTAAAPSATAPTATAPSVTAPSATAPAVRGPTVSSRGIRGPTVSGPRATGPRTSGPRLQGPRLQGPRAATPTAGTPTVGGGRLGGGTVAVGSGAADASTGGATQSIPTIGDASPTNPAATGDLGAIPEDPVPAAPSHQFAVQIGLFTDKDELKACLEELEIDGVTAYVKTLRSDLRRVVVYSVRLGPWPQRQAAEEAARNFRLEHGKGAAVVRQAVEPSS